MKKIIGEDLECVTTRILSKEKSILANITYLLNNLAVKLSRYYKPFSPGAFMLIKRKKFVELGSFNEKVHFAEDYFLTKNISGKKFGFADSYVLTSNRRFKKENNFKMAMRFIKTALNVNNDRYFYQDHKYWD